MENKVLHIFPNEKFTADFVNRICRLFDPTEHIFWIYGESLDPLIRESYDKRAQLVYDTKYSFSSVKRLIHMCRVSKKCIFHSLFMPPQYLVMCSLYIHKFGNKAFWNIWGADIYDTYISRNKNILHMAREQFRKRFIKHLHAVGYIPGDYAYLKAHYKTKATFISAPYSYDFIDIPETDKEETINVLIGNSATKTCQHMKAIDMLVPYKEKNIKVWCVLSYPKSKDDYRNKVIAYGKQKLGDKFFPLTEYMAYEDYVKLLSSIDIAIFNHDRQQALGNIVNLLFYGKRVFVNPMNSCGDYCRDMGAIVYSTDDFCEAEIKKMDSPKLKEQNQKAILQYFSDENYHTMWNTVFEL